MFGVDAVPPEEGAGADFASDDPSLTSWYTETAQDAEASQDAKTSQDAKASQDAKTSQDEPADERHEVATTTGVETEAESKDELRG